MTDFAAQAVIAIENARLLKDCGNRWSNRLEPQRCWVIQQLTGLEPVFENLQKNATHLCKASIGTLYLHEEGRVRLVAAHNMPAEFSRRKEVM